MDLQRRELLGWLLGGPLCATSLRSATTSGAGSAPTAAPNAAPFAAPLPTLRFTAGRPGAVDLSALLNPAGLDGLQLRLRANIARRDAKPGAFVPLSSQYPEFAVEGRMLRFDGGGAGAVAPGASAVRMQVEVTATRFEEAASITVSDIAAIVVDSPLAQIRHGLDRWDSFEALARAVQGDAAPGSAARGRTDLIGQTFEVTPGMFSEGINGRARGGPGPVATIHFPCTIKAQDPTRRPVFRSVSGERDIIQIEAQHFLPIDGEVVLQDLVIRDNRAWYNSGEAGVRIKDRFAGRSVRIERCEFVRCQNAVAGSSDLLRILDCRIVDCGLGDQAHSLYVQPATLEFFGNLITFSADNRFAQAHLLKTRALVSRILGNHISMNDAAVSYLVDLSNGGDCELGGNILHHGRRSDNTGATLVAYAPEGAGSDTGRQPPTFSAGRQFRLAARNNTLVSDFAGRTHFFMIDDHLGLRAEGGTAKTFPDPLVVADNLYWSAGAHALVTRRDRISVPSRSADISAQYAENTRAGRRPSATIHAASHTAEAGSAEDRNTAGPYTARRFTGHTYLGTGSEAHDFTRRGAA